jgi:hypothetical protein
MKSSFLSLHRLRRSRVLLAWAFVLLVLTVFVERRVAESDFDDSTLTFQNDEAVEGEEILNKLLLANDVVVPIAPAASRLDGETPVLLTPTAISLLAVRGLESRAPPSLPSTV